MKLIASPVIGALLSSLLLAGYAPGAQAAERQGRATKVARAEANGGNPQFYEVFGKAL